MNIPKNPFIESIYTADPTARTWDGETLYVYASHDMDPARGCDLMDKYHVFSTTDMVNWVDEGEILSSDDVKWGRPEGGFMWAPDCMKKGDTYYFFFPHPSDTKWNDSWKIGVATSKFPNKDFTDQGYIPNAGGFALIDPCVFIDDDETAYLYIGGGSRCMGGVLDDDMLSLKEEMRDMEGLVDFHEATWVFKRNGIYYLSYSDNSHGRNCMRYATSTNPLGPWEYKGIYLEATDCDTTHGSVVEFKGHWYQFYHNCNISGRGNLRSVCVDEIFFNDDGTIQTIKQTFDGVKTVVIPDGAKTYGLDSFVVSGGAVLERSAEDGVVGGFVGNMHGEGACLEIANVDGMDGGRATVWIRYATGEKLAKVNLNINGVDHSLLNMLSTGGFDDYSGYTRLTVRLNVGEVNNIKITGGNGEVNIKEVTVSYFRD